MALHQVTIISVTDIVNLVTRLSTATNIATDILVTTVNKVTNFTCPAKLFYTLRKFPVFIIPLLWDVKRRRVAEGRPEQTTVKTPKLEFPLLFRTAARNSSGDLEELHAVTAPYLVSGVWSVRPHYSVCVPAGIQTRF
jgi:hypothetical protein